MVDETSIEQCREAIDRAVDIIGSNSDTREAELLFRKCAENTSGKIRREAGERFGRRARGCPEPAFAFLKALAGDRSSNVRWTVGIALGELGRKDPGLVLSTLREMADDEDWSVRESVASALIVIATENPGVVPNLAEWAADPRENVRRAIAESLGRGIGQTKPELATPILADLVGDESLYVRKAVANSCRNMSRRHRGLILKTLFQWAEDSRENARWTVADGSRTIANVTPEEAIPLLYVLAKDERKYVRNCVLSVLREALKSNRDRIKAAMKRWLQDGDSSVREIARDILESQ